MLRYILTHNSEEEVSYQYYPEGNEEFGIITLSKKNNECEITLLAPTDTHKKYAFHMMRKMEKFAEEGTFQENGIVAWY